MKIIFQGDLTDTSAKTEPPVAITLQSQVTSASSE